MRVTDAVRTLAAHAVMSLYDVSRSCGRSESWAKGVAGREGVALATIADVADVAGCDIVIRDRGTGETVGVIDPPRRGK